MRPDRRLYYQSCSKQEAYANYNVTTKQKELLLYGHSRSNLLQDVPHDLILSFATWISNTVYMIIDSNNIAELESENKMNV